MLIAVPQNSILVLLPGSVRETFNCQNARMERAACNHRRASRGVVQNPVSGLCQPARQFKLSNLQNNYWIGEKSRRGRLMPAAFVGDSP
jgi:hypothetical protein